MKRPYEIPVVFRVISAEEEMQQAVDQVVSWIENSNDVADAGNVTRINRTLLGRRRLAYEINGQRDGMYYIFYANIDTEHLPELELNLRLYDNVLRYLIVRDESGTGSTPQETSPSPEEPRQEAQQPTETTES